MEKRENHWGEIKEEKSEALVSKCGLKFLAKSDVNLPKEAGLFHCERLKDCVLIKRKE